MSNTYQICEVTVTLPSLGTITTDISGNQIKHGDKCRVYLYAVQPDWRSGGTFEGFTVGWLTYEGYSESPLNRSQKIIMPDGYKLIALRVDECGIPTSWDSLPVHFSGGYISKGLADLSPFAMNDGQVFIKDAFIDKSIASADYSMKVGVKRNGEKYVAGMPLSVEKHSTEREKVQAVVSKYLKGEATEYTDELVDELMSLCRSAISIEHEVKPSSVEFNADVIAKTIKDEIARQLRPGGLIWRQIGNQYGI
ncbi:phage tail tip fiber protein [Pseudocitrobacter vendiensis]|uniref:Phage protein n=1 Tax=Pseudocitrobacter vendiensis TaxID=2488306 RepID=A0ABM9FDG4_9ENTR|nr:DUF1983 domain-containing protein [Pseudocitrobacter vendiensis]CAH6661261.1 hypothetical protein FBBNIHIM_19315 [Pseudocitrobacter vendiensis]